MRIILKYSAILIFIFNYLNFAQDTTKFELGLIEKNLPFGLIEKVSAISPQIGLALSGGGSRGLAQLGILRALVENDIPINYIVGTSMGSIIGGLYSAGYNLDDLDSILINASWDEFFSLERTDRNELFVDQKITEDKAIFALRLDGIKPVIPTALNTGQKVSNYLNMLTLNAPLHVNSFFDDLLYNYRAVSTDLITGKEVALDRGSLSKAMRASSSVSFLLAPVRWDSLLLVDGGLVANIPVKVAKDIGCDFIIASNTTSPLRKEEDLVYPWEIADQIVSIPMQIINKQHLDSANVIIKPILNELKNTDFVNAEDLIKKGYEATLPLIDSIKYSIEKIFWENIDSSLINYCSLELHDDATEIEKQFFYSLIKDDSISNKEIYYQLYRMFSTGDLYDLSAAIISDSVKSILKIYPKHNPIVEKIHLEKLEIFDEKDIKNYLLSLLNKPFNSKNLLESLLNILRHYRKMGYSLAEVDFVMFNEENNTIYLRISEGIIFDLQIEGNNITDRYVITREFPVKKGDYFHYENVERGLRNLTTINLFNNIELSIIKNYEGNKLIIKLDEKISRVFRFGLRIDNENLTQVSLDLRDENLLGSGTELGVIFSGGARNRSFTIEHKANRIFNTYLTYKIRAFHNFNDVHVYRDDSTGSERKFSRSKYSEYRQIFTGASLAIGTQLEKIGNIFFEWIFKEDEVKNKIDFPSDRTYKSTISSLKAGFSIDSQNKFPYPTQGFLVNSYYETAQDVLGGEVGYTKFEFNYKSYFTLDEIHTFSPRLSLGFADKTLPLSQQFDLGGQYSFFGLRDYEYRGRQVFTTSLEYRIKLPFRIFFDTYIKARYDLGSIWTNQEEIRFKDLRHGIGGTLSLDSPIGRADFSIGRSFLLTKTLPQNTISWGPIFLYFTIGYYY